MTDSQSGTIITENDFNEYDQNLWTKHFYLADTIEGKSK